ncbi:hypothetical protein DFJ74DRAFT_744958 [Hyaloraphidium curvatum]|nr:hypothetical protein DFJ74DRAFT_744958 [Hyaloraphidium curvatum]
MPFRFRALLRLLLPFAVVIAGFYLFGGGGGAPLPAEEAAAGPGGTISRRDADAPAVPREEVAAGGQSPGKRLWTFRDADEDGDDPDGKQDAGRKTGERSDASAGQKEDVKAPPGPGLDQDTGNDIRVDQYSRDSVSVGAEEGGPDSGRETGADARENPAVPGDSSERTPEDEPQEPANESEEEPAPPAPPPPRDATLPPARRPHRPNQAPLEDSPPPKNCRFPHIAVAIKTGRGVAHRRLPPALSTYASELCNVMLVTDALGEYNASELDPRYAGSDFYDADGPSITMLGTGVKDFVAVVGGRTYRARDVIGAIYSKAEPDAADPDADPMLVAKMRIFHKDRWEAGAFDRAKARADDLAKAYADARKEERKKERLGQNKRRRRLRKRGEGGTREGWARDADKFIPAIAEMWNRFPDARWYFLFDDDSYGFVPAIYHHMVTFMPWAEPHYVGKAMLFSGCHWEPRQAGEEVLGFASAAGILISRGAMLRGMPYVQAAEEKTKTCWAGDARVAMWFYDAGFRLDWPGEITGRMHVGPQTMWHSFGRACDPVLVYHLMPPAKYEAIWAVQRSPGSAGGFVTNADMWHIFHDPKEDGELAELEGGFEWDTNRGDMDFLALSKHPPGTTEAAYVEMADAKLQEVLDISHPPPHLKKALVAIRAMGKRSLAPGSSNRTRIALALRCLTACHAMAGVRDFPQAVADPKQPIATSDNRTGTPWNTLGNRSPAFGPCIMWTLNPENRCFLKSGFSAAPLGGAPGHVSGIVGGAKARYEAMARKGAAGEKCGWGVGRSATWDRD